MKASSKSKKKSTKKDKSEKEQKTSQPPKEEKEDVKIKSKSLKTQSISDGIKEKSKKEVPPPADTPVPEDNKQGRVVSGGFTLEQVFQPAGAGVDVHTFYGVDIPGAGPRFTKKKKDLGANYGYLVNGPQYFPQFIRIKNLEERKFHQEEMDRDYPDNTFGLLFGYGYGKVSFYPHGGLHEGDENGNMKWLADNQKPNDVVVKPLIRWYEQERLRRKGLRPAVFMEQRKSNMISEKTRKKLDSILARPIGREKEKKEEKEEKKKKTSKKRLLFYGIGLVVLFLVLLLACYGLWSLWAKYIASKVETPCVTPETAKAPSPVAGGTGSDTGATTENTTTLPTTTTTRVYPAMTPVSRVPLVSFHSTTFDIVSATLELHMVRTLSSFISSPTKVIYQLNITSTTKVIQLRSAVKSIGSIEVTDSKGELIGNIRDKQYDEISQILTLNLPSPISSVGIIKVDISYTMSGEAFEMSSLPYDQETCSFFILRKLCYLVPHFEYFVKHTWKINVVEHPTNVEVLTNAKMDIPDRRDKRRDFSLFLESLPLVPGEVSFVLVENYPISRGARMLHRVISILTEKTKEKEVSNLTTILTDRINSITPPLKETICFVVVPGMESCEFIGKNVAFIGTGLLRSKMEIIENFAWIWVFRLILYQKVITLDKNPTWIYEQSAVFLASTTKSNHGNVWNKYNYEMAMDSGRSGIEGPSNKSIVYEDEQRYFEKPGHSAKVFTVLGMVTSIGGFVADDILANLKAGRDITRSIQYFFLKPQMDLGNGEKMEVYGMTSCYIDSHATPLVHFRRTNKSHVAVQRTDMGQTNRCDMPLWLEKGENNTNATNKEHKLLTDKVEKVQVEADSVVVLSGDSPFSAYGYTIDQTELDKLLDDSFDVASYDDSSLNLLASNVVRAAAEGKLSYESVYGLLRKLLQGKVVSVDDVVDLWMWTVSQSRNDSLLSLTEPIVASVLNTTGKPSDTASVAAYYISRVEKSIKDGALFEIKKAVKMVNNCGRPCRPAAFGYYMKVECVMGNDKDCPYDPHFLEMYACTQIAHGNTNDRPALYELYEKCPGKPCRLPALRGLLCSQNVSKIDSWMDYINKMEKTDSVNRETIMVIYEGLASNVVYRPLLFPYFLENWHLLHEKFSKYPTFLGSIIDTLASTIVTREQLVQFEQFVAFYGDSLNMYREFKDQIIRAQKAVEWNAKFSQVFTNLFQNP